MKPRADKFVTIADSKAIKTIQAEVQKNSEYVGEVDDLESANRLLSIYLKISMDEGYRKALDGVIEDSNNYHKIEVKPRKKGLVKYVDEDETKRVLPLLRRRIGSKRQRKHFFEGCPEAGEEQFILAMVIHTGFEYGYNKLAGNFNEIAKVVCGDNADIVIEMFNEIVGGRV